MNSFPSRCIFLISLLLLTGFAKSESARPGEPVSGIEILIELDPDDEPIFNSRTDAGGQALFTLKRAGTVRIKLILPPSMKSALPVSALHILLEQKPTGAPNAKATPSFSPVTLGSRTGRNPLSPGPKPGIFVTPKFPAETNMTYRVTVTCDVPIPPPAGNK